MLALEAHADINVKDNNGTTPFHLACDKGHESIARMLALEAHADVTIQANDGRTVSEYAAFFANQT